jgi:hypothetical protein
MDNEKLISCFPTFKENQNLCFMPYADPEINAPKQYASFSETIFLETEKTGKLFLNRDNG